MAITNGGLEWMRDGVCAKPENKEYENYFFSADPEERYAAKNLCYTCPVRRDCVVYALESGTIWGIWGARDENELRRTLSVSAEGNEVRRGRYPQCPYCSARTSRLSTKIIDLPDGGRWTTAKVVVCGVCGTEWRSRSSANAVNAYFAERAAKKERAQAKKMKKASASTRRPSSSARQLPSTGEQPRRNNDSPES